MKQTVFVLSLLSLLFLFQSCKHDSTAKSNEHSHVDRGNHDNKGHNHSDGGHDHGDGGHSYHHASDTKVPSIKDPNIIGRWEAPARDDKADRIIEFKDGFKWNYYKNDERVERGTYHINNDVLTLVHVVNEHEHKEGEKHDHPEDHRYKYRYNSDKSELIFDDHGEKSVYKRITN